MSPQALGSHLLDDQEGDTNSRVQNIKQKILLIDKINKAVIAEQPSCGPWVKKHERIPGENEARLTPHDHPATPGFFPPKGGYNVQSHDILYKVSRDILYTLRAGSTGPERL
jgi:hypothetical protein